MRTLPRPPLALLAVPLLASLLLAAPGVPAARAASSTPAPLIAAPHGVLTLQAGQGRVVGLSAAAASVFAADPKVAQVRPASPTTLFIFGVAPGRTTVAALDSAGHPLAQYDVVVNASAYGADAAAAEIARIAPDAHVRVAATPQGLTLSGTVPTAEEASRILAAVHGYAAPKQTIVDRMVVLGSVQVDLKVKIAEMSRTLVRELGVNWNALGNIGVFGKEMAGASPFTFAAANALQFNPGAAATAGLSLLNSVSPAGVAKPNSLDSTVSALAQDNLVRLLAEPTLTAMSGQTASFLVGGEFAIPIPQQGGTISVQYQPYGVSLSFIPTVLSNGEINIRVKPEVSELTTVGSAAISANGVAPGLFVRKAETTVQLGSGQSFAIAGLLQDSVSQGDSGLPGLGDLPILGALFRSDSFQRQQSELVIIITPYIVRPVNNAKQLHAPTDGYVAPSDLERILLLRQEGRKAPAGPTIPGDAGFILQ